MSSLPTGHQPEHLAEIAESVAVGSYNGLIKVKTVTPVLMADPYAARVDLGSDTQIRVMWVIDATEVIATPGVGKGPKYAVGTTLRELILVDDSTLRLGGTFVCGVLKL